MKKKILIYADTMNLSGGRERVIANLMNLWIHKYELFLLVKDDGESYYPLNNAIRIESLRIPMKLNLHSKISRIITILINLLVAIPKLKNRLSKMDYDYLYVSTPLNAFEAYYAMRNPKKKLVISEHASKNSFNAVYTMMKNHIYSKSYCISVPNITDTKEYNNEGCNAIYIPHTLTFSAEKRNALDSKILLNVGRLTADKQQDLLIRVWSRIVDKNGWKLCIVGEGEEKENLECLITTLCVQDTVSLLPARKNIKEIYETASSFILTSRCEGFGMVLLEAMAFGIPCVSFDCPSGPRDIIVNNHNGILVNFNDDKELEAAIKTIITMPQDKLQQMGSNAYKTVADWDNASIIEQWSNNIFI